MIAHQLSRDPTSPQGHVEGMTSGTTGLGSRPPGTCQEAEWPCSRGLQTGLTTEQTTRKEPLPVVFSTTVGGEIPWANIPRLHVPATVLARQTESPCLGAMAATLLAAQPDQRPAGSQSPFRLCHQLQARPGCLPLSVWRSLGCTTMPHLSLTRSSSGGQWRPFWPGSSPMSGVRQ